jgi:hypothetical protein
MQHSVKSWLLVLTLSSPASVLADNGPLAFSPEAIAQWSERSFEGRTAYTVVSPDRAGTAHSALRADCAEATASGRFLEREISLEDTPILEWRWRVDRLYTGLDERRKSGDDYPARIYVVARRWPAFRSRAINYVWSSSESVGSTWPNAFSDAFAMVAVRSGTDQAGKWVRDSRDVREDFRRLHGLELDTVDGVAIMTDCDNAGQSTTAWYGPVRWLPAGDRPASPAEPATDGLESALAPDQGRPRHDQPGHHQRRAAERRDVGQALDAGQGRCVDAEAEQHGAGDEQPPCQPQTAQSR